MRLLFVIEMRRQDFPSKVEHAPLRNASTSSKWTSFVRSFRIPDLGFSDARFFAELFEVQDSGNGPHSIIFAVSTAFYLALGDIKLDVDQKDVRLILSKGFYNKMRVQFPSQTVLLSVYYNRVSVTAISFCFQGDRCAILKMSHISRKTFA